MNEKITELLKKVCPHLVKVRAMVVENTYHAEGDYYNKQYVERRVCATCGKVLDD